MATVNAASREAPRRSELESAVIRFAGDSGDGMQLTGSQFTTATALAGNDLATFPDFPAEIRAPAGTTFGVSTFQINFGASRIVTPGDDLSDHRCESLGVPGRSRIRNPAGRQGHRHGCHAPQNHCHL